MVNQIKRKKHAVGISCAAVDFNLVLEWNMLLLLYSFNTCNINKRTSTLTYISYHRSLFVTRHVNETHSSGDECGSSECDSFNREHKNMEKKNSKETKLLDDEFFRGRKTIDEKSWKIHLRLSQFILVRFLFKSFKI